MTNIEKKFFLNTNQKIQFVVGRIMFLTPVSFCLTVNFSLFDDTLDNFCDTVILLCGSLTHQFC